jgi:hypothetical protein
MYCPRCQAEYREGFIECSACGVPLVEGFPTNHLSDAHQLTPNTRLGSKGTRLIFVYLAWVVVIVLIIMFAGTDVGLLPVIAAIFGIASGITVITRHRLALNFVYLFLGTVAIIGLLGIYRVFETSSSGYLIGQIVGGIVVPLAWFLYFRRRRKLFA